MNHTFKVSWMPKYSRWPKGQRQSDPINSLDAAIAFANSGECANARSCTILRADNDGINAGKFFLQQIVK